MSADIRKGICLLKCDKGHMHGIVLLEETREKGPVKFRVFVKGVDSGLHGFHIHRRGNEFAGSHSLCDHFNPTNQRHGDLNTKKSHIGDLGNLSAFPVSITNTEDVVVGSTGIINTEFIANRVRLSGSNSIFGRSLVIHDSEDDLGLGDHDDSSTTGHSGKRILWGIIGVNDGDDCDSPFTQLPPIIHTSLKDDI